MNSELLESMNSLTSEDLSRLTPTQLTELDSLLWETGTPPLWTPLPGPQTRAAESPADVLGFGGAAGGGKSQTLLGLAITKHRRSIIFRRESVQGRGLIDDARRLLGNLGRFNEQTGLWRDLPGGRQIEFAGVKDPGDEHKYKGRPHDFIGFDEADSFSEHVVRFLQGWLRTTIPGQRCRVVLCFNPPANAEGRWLMSYFGPWLDRKHSRPALPGELRWYATLPNGKETERPDGMPFVCDGETITPRSRTFIPARVHDNPFLLSTGYVATLQALPEPLRSQYLYGDFSAGLEDDPWQVIPTAWVLAAQDRWRRLQETGGPHLERGNLSAVGVDVARGGQDKTVLAKRYKTWFAPLEKHEGRKTPDGQSVAGLIVKAVLNGKNATVNIDVIGVGAAAFDICRMQRVRNVNGVNFANGTNLRDKSKKLEFKNVRAYAYWSLRESLDPNTGENLALPPDPELLADLTAARWSMGPGGVKVEKKEEIQKRIGRSPDCADAVVLAHYTVKQPQSFAPYRCGGYPGY